MRISLAILIGICCGCVDQSAERERVDRKFDDVMEHIQTLEERINQLQSNQPQIASSGIKSDPESTSHFDPSVVTESTASATATVPSTAVISNLTFEKDGSEGDDPFIGRVDAPVTMFLFSGFECERCLEQFRTVFPELKKNYVDPGLLKIILRDFPLPHHRDGMRAAETAHCIGEKGGYWKIFDTLIERKTLRGDIIPANLTPAERSRVERCVKVGKYRSEIDEDIENGTKLGVIGIPTAIIFAENNDASSTEDQVQDQNGEKRSRKGNLHSMNHKPLAAVKIRGSQPFLIYEKEIKRLLAFSAAHNETQSKKRATKQAD